MWTKQEIRDKIDSEGGLYGFFRWGGVTKDDIPPEIYPEYALAEQAWRDFCEREDILMDVLPQL